MLVEDPFNLNAIRSLAKISEAMSSARREKESIDARTSHDRERHAAQSAKIQVYTAQLTETKNRIAALEYSQQDTNVAMSDLTEKITTSYPGHPPCHGTVPAGR